MVDHISAGRTLPSNLGCSRVYLAGIVGNPGELTVEPGAYFPGSTMLATRGDAFDDSPTRLTARSAACEDAAP